MELKNDLIAFGLVEGNSAREQEVLIFIHILLLFFLTH